MVIACVTKRCSVDKAVDVQSNGCSDTEQVPHCRCYREMICVVRFPEEQRDMPLGEGAIHQGDCCWTVESQCEKGGHVVQLKMSTWPVL